jgi:hypothetical protein
MRPRAARRPATAAATATVHVQLRERTLRLATLFSSVWNSCGCAACAVCELRTTHASSSATPPAMLRALLATMVAVASAD